MEMQKKKSHSSLSHENFVIFFLFSLWADGKLISSAGVCVFLIICVLVCVCEWERVCVVCVCLCVSVCLWEREHTIMQIVSTHLLAPGTEATIVYWC